MKTALVQWIARLIAMVFVALGVADEKAADPANMIATGLVAGIAIAIDTWLSHRRSTKMVATITQQTQAQQPQVMTMTEIQEHWRTGDKPNTK